jgi:transcriptional regulator GlxA family with amidase domain
MNPAVSSTAGRDGTAPSLDRAPSLDPRLVASRTRVSPLPGTLGHFQAVSDDPRIRLAETIMYHNLSRTLSLNELARRTGVSISRLSHLFKAEVGTSPKQYLKSLRLCRAKCLLEISVLSVKEVAADVGLSAGALIREFRRAYGASPGRHRRDLRVVNERIAPISELPGAGRHERSRIGL